MNGIIITLVSLFGLLATPAQAEWIRYQDYKVKIDAPKDWKIETDLYGVPVTALGPERGGERAVVLIQHTALTEARFDEKELNSQKDEYITARKEWLAKADNATFEVALPAVYHSQASRLTGYEFGYRYRLREHRFEERSLQLSCAGKVYLVKTLSSEKNTAQDLNALSKIVAGFDCSTVTPKDGPYIPGPLHAIQDSLKAFRLEEWPGIQDFHKATAEEKAKGLEALVEFYQRYDEASAAEDESFSAAPSKCSLLFQNFVKRLNRLIQGAEADETYDCFFGGWPSKFFDKEGKGHLTCDNPEHRNSEYAKYASRCGAGQMVCNPALFGEGLCVGIEQASMRRHVTLECELKFKSTGKTFADVVKEKNFDEKLLNETIESAKDVCNRTEYVQNNYGLCNTLKEKLQVSIASSKHQKSESDDQFAHDIDQMKPDDLEALLKEVNDGWDSFQKDCIDANGKINGDDLSCVERQKKFVHDFSQIEKAKSLASRDTSSARSNANCNKGDCGGNETDAVPAPEGSCNAKETARMKDPANACQWKSLSWIMKGPLKNVFMSFTADLWGTVYGVAELGWSGLKGVGHMVGFGKADSQMADKAHQSSQTKDSFLTSLRQHPVDTVVAIFQSLVDQIVHFIDNDVYCQQWSGRAHFSHCDLPANRVCISCTDRINGYSSMIGYAMGEALPFLLSGGVASLAAKSETVLKMGEFLSKSSRTGKFIKLAAEAQSHLPSLSKLKLDLVEKIALATDAAKNLERVKLALGVLEKWTASFKSVYGTAEKTLAALKDSSKVIRGGALVARLGVKAAVKTVGFVAKIPSIPGELLYRAGFKVVEKIIDRQALKAIERETIREVESGFVIITQKPKYLSPIARELPVNTAKIADKVAAYKGDVTAAQFVEARPGFIGRAFERNKDRLPKAVSKPIHKYIAWRTDKKDDKYFNLLTDQEKLLKDLQLETDPAKFALLSPEERLDQIKRAKKFGFWENRKLNKNAEAIEKTVGKSGEKIDLPSRVEAVSFGSTYFRKILATAPVAKYVDSLGAVKQDAKLKLSEGHNQKDLEILAKEKGMTAEQVKAEEQTQAELTPLVLKIRDKAFAGTHIDAADEAVLKKAKITSEQMHGIVKNLYVIELGCKLQAAKLAKQKPSLTEDEQKHQKALGQSEEQIMTNVEELSQEPGFACP